MTPLFPANHTCYACIWRDQCFQYDEHFVTDVCIDFLPTDEDDDDLIAVDEESFELTYYENDLKMRVDVYQEMIDEYSDGNVTYDGF